MPIAYYKALDNIIVANITESGTAQRFPLGMVVRGFNAGTATGTKSNIQGGAIFQYCRGSDVSSAGQFVQIQGNSAVLAAAAAGASYFPIGVAAAPMTATNVFGFVQIHGICDYVLSTNEDHTAGNPLYINAGTAGLVQSTPVAGQNIEGAVNLVAFSSSGATGTGTDLLYSNLTVQLRFPHIVGTTDSI